MKSITKPGSRLFSTSIPGFLLVLFIWACHLNQEGGKENVFSLGALADSLKKYDSVKVYILAPDGDTLDLIFKGKVTDRSDLVDRPAPNYPGGRAVISIVGYDDDRIVLKVDRIYAGKEGGIESVKNIILPGIEIKIGSPDLEISVGEEFPLPAVTVTPDSLSDKSIRWSSSDSNVLSIAEGRFKGLADGSVDLKAALKVDPSRQATLYVRVKAKVAGTAPDSLAVTPETLQVTVNGGSRRFNLDIHPAGADREVTWHCRDEAKARINAAGEAEGLQPGLVRIWAASKVDPKVTDSAWVEVKAEVSVTKVEFDRDVMNLFVGGTPDTLIALVRPDLANQAVDFVSADTSIARVRDSKAEGRKAGETRIVVSSRQDASKTDTLKVVVTEPEVVERVEVKPVLDTLYTGGDSTLLTATITPSKSSQRVRWTSSDEGFATVDTNGKVLPVAPGTAYIKAVSRLDTTKSATVTVVVKRDPPVFSINSQDTTVAVGTTITWSGTVDQKFGIVTRFEWNLDGDTAWDGSSADVKPVSHRYSEEKEIKASFRIRDSEGNVTTVDKKVKAVNGPIILITSPAHNSSVNKTLVSVAWSVDGKPQTTDTTEVLVKDGANTITRQAKDAANNTYLASITVFLDTVPPGKPLVTAVTPVNTQTPRWTWKSGGNGGIGTYRCMLTLADSGKAADLKDTLYVAPAKLAEGLHTLYVQERDAAGNWSKPGEFKVQVDLTAPAAPKVASAQAVTAELRPVWTWASAAAGSKAFAFRYRLDTADMAKHTVVKDSSYAPASDLAATAHTLYVQESDSAGNWSASGSFTVTIDRTPPAAPVFSTALLSPLNSLRPTWAWASGGGGGIGTYRVRVDNPDLSAATPFTGISYTPPANLAEGSRTLYVQERDSAGNWSAAASKALVLALRDTVGKRGLSASGAGKLDFTICPDGTPHIVFTDIANSSKLSVMRFTGGVWSYLGNPGFSEFSASGHLTVACDKNNKVYVAYNSSLIGQVYSYSGSAWAKVGTGGMGEAANIAMAIANSGVPYIAYGDRGGYLRVDSLSSGDVWSTTNLSTIAKSFYANYSAPMEMKFTFQNELYFGFADRSANGSPNIMSWRGGQWWDFSGPTTGLPTDTVTSISIGFPKTSGTLGTSVQVTLAYKGKISHYTVSSMTWTPLGGAGFGSAQSASLAMYAGFPYVAFSDKANSDKAAVRFWNGTSWVSMSGTGMSVFTTENIRIAVHPTSGLPYVAFIEPGNGKKITVMKTAFDQP